MIKSAVTVCLVSEARQGPFVFHDGLADGCARAAKLGFDAVEIFPRAVEDLKIAKILVAEGESLVVDQPIIEFE